MESWYFDHIIRYQAYLEDTVFCNNNPSNGDVSLSCPSDRSFSLANNNISYPVGLLTLAEANLAGLSTTQSTYSYLYTGQVYWLMSKNPRFDYDDSNWLETGGKLNLNGDGYGGTGYYGLRPVISLSSETILTDGDGSQTSPYKVSLQ